MIFDSLRAKVVAVIPASQTNPFARVTLEYEATGKRETVARDAVRRDGAIAASSTEVAAMFPDMGHETAQLLTDEADHAHGMDDPGKLGEFIRRETDPITLATLAETLYRVSRRDDGRYQVTQVMHEQRSQA